MTDDAPARLCACGNQGTIKRPSAAWICTRCARLEKQNHLYNREAPKYEEPKWILSRQKDSQSTESFPFAHHPKTREIMEMPESSL